MIDLKVDLLSKEYFEKEYKLCYENNWYFCKNYIIWKNKETACKSCKYKSNCYE